MLTNAIKFTARGYVNVRVFRKRSFLVTEVIDSGVGIKQKHLGRLFKFFASPSSVPNAQSYGLGLGLTVVRMKSQQLGGNVWVESFAGKGSKFSFTIADNLCEKTYCYSDSDYSKNHNSEFSSDRPFQKIKFSI